MHVSASTFRTLLTASTCRQRLQDGLGVLQLQQHAAQRRLQLDGAHLPQLVRLQQLRMDEHNVVLDKSTQDRLWRPVVALEI